MRQAALLPLQWCPSPWSSVQVLTGLILCTSLSLLPPPTSLWGSILQLVQTGAQNSLERQASWGCKARCLAPPCCPQPKGGLRVACLHWRRRSSQPRNPGQEQMHQNTAYNCPQHTEGSGIQEETLPSTPELLQTMLSENCPIK